MSDSLVTTIIHHANNKTQNHMNKFVITFAVMGMSLAAMAQDSQGTASARTNLNAPITQADFTTAAQSTVNGVVSVKSYATPRMRQQASPFGGNGFFDDPLFEYFFGSPRQQQPRQQQQEAPKQRQIGLGSGVIISQDGYIVTNNHVIDGAERLEVTLNDNRNYNAKVIGSDATTDLALIQIDAPDLHVIPMGNSEDLMVGEWVLAVGNPFGFTSTVTSGIVSAKARSISSVAGGGRGGIESYIQTDAAVNQGNSGGALVNLKGELVGINTAIYSSNGAYVGCSFAIPTTIVTKVVDDLKKFGAVQRAFLGVTTQEVTPELVQDKELKNVTAGIYVVKVQDRSAGREAGLKEGDVIVAINGLPTNTIAQLQEAMARFSPGNEIVITFIRDGKLNEKSVTLRNDRGDTSMTKSASLADLGCAFTKVPQERLEQLEISRGVQVTGIDEGRVKDAGIRDGFIILTVNGTPVTSPDDMEKIYTQVMKSDDDKVLFIKGIYPTGKQAFYAVPLAD